MSELQGRLLLQGALVPGRLRWEGGRLTEAQAMELAAAANLPVIAPGLVDLHLHGFGGCDPLEDLAVRLQSSKNPLRMGWAYTARQRLYSTR